jgi:truncated hemoglobin YjbI
MATRENDLILKKVSAIIQGPDGELFHRIVETFYERIMEGVDFEPLTPDELTMVEESKKAFQRGEYVTLQDFAKKQGI